VVLYPRPTAFSAHTLIVIDPSADQLLEALMSTEMQELAWTKHGFRGPLGTAVGAADQAIAGLLPATIEAVLPMPSTDVMLGHFAKRPALFASFVALTHHVIFHARQFR
jgi:hypothetical protein